jgi:chromosome segregation ATPase
LQTAQDERDRAERELLDQHGSRADLEEHRKCSTIEETENAISGVTEEIDDAATKLKAASDAAEVVARDITRLASRQATLEQSLMAGLFNAATTLGASGPLGGAIKLDEIEFDLPDASPIELSQQRLQVRLDGLAELLGDYHEQAEVAAGPITLPDLSALYADELDQLVGNLTSTIDSVDRQYRAAESRVHKLVEKLRGCCNTAPERAAGKVVESLKTATTIELIEQAETFAHDAAQRLASVSHALAKFETEIDTTVQIVHVRVQDVRRRIQATARASILPNLPTLGVWAGLPFLKIGWADLGRDERLRQLRLAIV